MGLFGRYFYIADDHGYASDLHPSLGTISNQRADDLVENHKHILGPPLEITRKNIGTQQLRRVSNPNWHSTSWLLLDEAKQSLSHFGYKLDQGITRNLHCFYRDGNIGISITDLADLDL